MILAVIEDEVFLIAIFFYCFLLFFLVVLRFFDMFHKKLKIESI